MMVSDHEKTHHIQECCTFRGCETGSTLSLVEIAAEYSTEISNNKMAHKFVQKNNFQTILHTQ